jgi:predicted nucleotidyltransferase/DNA-binding XRE family transcriptional regulator
MGGDTAEAAFRRALIAARAEAGLTQAEVAAKVGATSSAIARLESGRATATVQMLSRLADVLALRFEIAPHQGLRTRRLPQRGLTLADLRARRDDIERIAAGHGAANVRVFGSVARGEADAASDVDLLVDIVVDADGLAYFGVIEDLREDLSELLGRKVDILDAAQLGRIRERVLSEAVPV